MVALLIYGVAVRVWLASMYVAATTLHLGSHYDLSEVVRFTNMDGTVAVLAPGGFAQLMRLAILPQLFFWPLYTLLAGLVGAALFRLAMRLFDLSSPDSPALSAVNPDARSASAPGRCVAPTPEPQRRLSSLKVTQKKPSLQSVSEEQVSHSSPLVQPMMGSAARARINSKRVRRMNTRSPYWLDLPGPDERQHARSAREENSSR